MQKYGIFIDDDPSILGLALRVLTRLGEVRVFPQVEEGLEHLADAAYIVSDYDMPGMGGKGLIEMVRAGKLRAPLIILSGLDSSAPQMQDLKCLGIEYLAKPFSSKELLARTSRLLALG